MRWYGRERRIGLRAWRRSVHRLQSLSIPEVLGAPMKKIAPFIPLLSLVLFIGGQPPPVGASPGPVRIGAVFPLQGSLAPLAREEYRGVQIARDLANARGGVNGRQ